MDKVIDHFNGNEIKYPVDNPRPKYDFHFRKIGDDIWRYIFSDDNLREFGPMAEVVLADNCQCRVVVAATGEVVELPIM